MRKKTLRFLIVFLFLCAITIFAGEYFKSSNQLAASSRNSVDAQPNKKIIEESSQTKNVQASIENTTENVQTGTKDNTENVQANTQENNNVQISSQNNEAATNKYSLENATFLNSDGKHMIKDPNDLLVLVNKTRNLPSDWVPDDLVIPNVTFAFSEDSPRKYMRKAAASALEELFNQAKKDKINIAATSGYRSYDTQKRIFAANAKIYGEAVANRTSAYPGQSEHQTGLAMDITSRSVNFGLTESFGEKAEGKWLRENAAKYGFIIRYPKGKESITKYSYEPWHVRYVGKEAANYIMQNNITLEEYFNAVD